MDKVRSRSTSTTLSHGIRHPMVVLLLIWGAVAQGCSAVPTEATRKLAIGPDAPSAAVFPIPSYCTHYWKSGVSGVIDDSTKWSPATPITADDTLCIVAPGTYEVSLTAPGGGTAALQIGGPSSNVTAKFFDQGVWGDRWVLLRAGSTLVLDSSSLFSRRITIEGTLTLNASWLVADTVFNDGTIACVGGASGAAMDNGGVFENRASIRSDSLCLLVGDHGRIRQTGGSITGASPVVVMSTSQGAFEWSGGTLGVRANAPTESVVQVITDTLILGNLALAGTIEMAPLFNGTIRGSVGAGVHLDVGGSADSVRFVVPQALFTNAGTIELRRTGGQLPYEFPPMVNSGTINVVEPSTILTDSLRNVGTGQIVLSDDLRFARAGSTLSNEATIARTVASAELVMRPTTTFRTRASGVMTGELVLDRATLTGVGQVGNVVSLGGTVAPGVGLGTITAKSVTLDPASTLAVDIGGTSVGSYDQLVVTGGIHYGGTLSIRTLVTFAGGACGQVVPSITDNSVVPRGAFTTVTGLGAQGPGREWRAYNPKGTYNVVGFNPDEVVHFTRSSLSVAEGGVSDTLQSCLGRTAPTAAVTVNLPATLGQVTATPAVFSLTDWVLPRTITTSAIDDAVVEAPLVDVLAATTSSADAAYNALALANPTVSVTDNDGSADVVVTYREIPATILAGQSFTFGVQATNNGPTAITGGTLAMSGVVGFTITSVSGAGCSWTATTMNCPLTALAAAGKQTVFVTATAGAAGSYANTATVAGHQPDPLSTNNTVTHVFVVQ